MNTIIFFWGNIEMHHFKDELTAFFDCDDTLVKWNANMSWREGSEGVLQFNSVQDLEVPQWMYLKPHKIHIEKLKVLKKNGYGIVVWSAGGSWWAREVVRVLQLENYVDVVMCKPARCYDDLTIEQALGKTIYLMDEI